MHMKQFNYNPFTYAKDVFTIPKLVEWLNQQMNLLSQSLKGAVVKDAGNSGATKTVVVQVADLTAVLLTNNVTLTLSVDTARKGQSGMIEFTQDAIGSRTVTFVNLVGTSPTITATLNKRTLVLFTNVGDSGWVATVLASNY